MAETVTDFCAPKISAAEAGNQQGYRVGASKVLLALGPKKKMFWGCFPRGSLLQFPFPCLRTSSKALQAATGLGQGLLLRIRILNLFLKYSGSNGDVTILYSGTSTSVGIRGPGFMCVLLVSIGKVRGGWLGVWSQNEVKCFILKNHSSISSTWIFFPKKVVLDLEKIRVSTSKKVSTFFCAKSITVIQVFGTTRYVQWHGVSTPK